MQWTGVKIQIKHDSNESNKSQAYTNKQTYSRTHAHKHLHFCFFLRNWQIKTLFRSTSWEFKKKTAAATAIENKFIEKMNSKYLNVGVSRRFSFSLLFTFHSIVHVRGGGKRSVAILFDSWKLKLIEILRSYTHKQNQSFDWMTKLFVCVCARAKTGCGKQSKLYSQTELFLFNYLLLRTHTLLCACDFVWCTFRRVALNCNTFKCMHWPYIRNVGVTNAMQAPYTVARDGKRKNERRRKNTCKIKLYNDTFFHAFFVLIKVEWEHWFLGIDFSNEKLSRFKGYNNNNKHNGSNHNKRNLLHSKQHQRENFRMKPTKTNKLSMMQA